MADCYCCKYAVWDYETYYNGTQKQWFVCDCKKDHLGLEENHECEDYKEGVSEDD